MTRDSPQTERLILIMELLADAPETGRSLADIARHLGVAKATCYPMVMALTESGWLIRHPVQRSYRLGPALIPIGRAAESATDIVDLARTSMHALADRSGMACLGFIPSGESLVVAEVVQPRSGRVGTLGLRLGDSVALTPPLGSVLAEWFLPPELDEWYARGARELELDESELRSRYTPTLELIRQRGYAVECIAPLQSSLAEAIDLYRGRGVGARSSVAAIRQARRLLSADILIGEIDRDHLYRPISINSVAFDSAGKSALVLCLVDAPHAMPGSQVCDLGALVREAADRLTALAHGRRPASHTVD
ncbi:helix-turn-helix domain-containing protein [Rhodococcus opacus]|nr:helix-turn-helix domain-containing protein [Rhodococcus opacus]